MEGGSRSLEFRAAALNWRIGGRVSISGEGYFKGLDNLHRESGPRTERAQRQPQGNLTDAQGGGRVPQTNGHQRGRLRTFVKDTGSDAFEACYLTLGTSDTSGDQEI